MIASINNYIQQRLQAENLAEIQLVRSRKEIACGLLTFRFNDAQERRANRGLSEQLSVPMISVNLLH